MIKEQIMRPEMEKRMRKIAPEVIAIADACLGGLYGRSALLIGPDDARAYFIQGLQRAGMNNIFQEHMPLHVPLLLPKVQLFINMPDATEMTRDALQSPLVTAAMIAKGCEQRRTPLLIFDLATSSSVEELAGLLPTVCLYTPEDLRRVLAHLEVRA